MQCEAANILQPVKKGSCIFYELKMPREGRRGRARSEKVASQRGEESLSQGLLSAEDFWVRNADVHKYLSSPEGGAPYLSSPCLQLCRKLQRGVSKRF